MPHVRRTFTAPPGVEVKMKPQTFFLMELNSRVVGPYVNNKVIYDLKKKGKSVVELEHGREIIFEVVDPMTGYREMKEQAELEKPQHDL